MAFWDLWTPKPKKKKVEPTQVGPTKEAAKRLDTITGNPGSTGTREQVKQALTPVKKSSSKSRSTQKVGELPSIQEAIAQIPQQEPVVKTSSVNPPTAGTSTFTQQPSTYTEYQKPGPIKSAFNKFTSGLVQGYTGEDPLDRDVLSRTPLEQAGIGVAALTNIVGGPEDFIAGKALSALGPITPKVASKVLKNKKIVRKYIKEMDELEIGDFATKIDKAIPLETTKFKVKAKGAIVELAKEADPVNYKKIINGINWKSKATAGLGAGLISEAVTLNFVGDDIDRLSFLYQELLKDGNFEEAAEVEKLLDGMKRFADGPISKLPFINAAIGGYKFFSDQIKKNKIAKEVAYEKFDQQEINNEILKKVTEGIATPEEIDYLKEKDPKNSVFWNNNKKETEVVSKQQDVSKQQFDVTPGRPGFYDQDSTLNFGLLDTSGEYVPPVAQTKTPIVPQPGDENFVGPMQPEKTEIGTPVETNNPPNTYESSTGIYTDNNGNGTLQFKAPEGARLI